MNDPYVWFNMAMVFLAGYFLGRSDEIGVRIKDARQGKYVVYGKDYDKPPFNISKDDQ